LNEEDWGTLSVMNKGLFEEQLMEVPVADKTEHFAVT